MNIQWNIIKKGVDSNKRLRFDIGEKIRKESKKFPKKQKKIHNILSRQIINYILLLSYAIFSRVIDFNEFNKYGFNYMWENKDQISTNIEYILLGIAKNILR